MDFIFNSIKSFFVISVVLIFVWFFYMPFSVSWKSMEPNYYPWDLVIAETFIYRRIPKIDRFDVLIVNHGWTTIIKRAIWLPWECVKLEDNKLYINWEFVENKYTSFNINYQNTINLCLKEDEYFILGDNQNVSLDSRFFWPIFDNEIKWRVKIHYQIWK